MYGASTNPVTAKRIGRLGRFARRLRDDTRGNALVIGGATILLLIAALGGGIDMSRAYMTKTNLQSACDAGVLAGRRALSKSGTYGQSEKDKATKMFNFNMHAAATQATDVVFDSSSQDDGSVLGNAKATMPTVIMDMFGTEDFDLKVECSAELQMASADVMFVLDVTGSMDEDLGDGKKIVGLRAAVRDFHKTVSQAVIDKDKTVIRYAFVPYSQTVNASGLIATGAMPPAWFPDKVYRMPTRIALFNQRYTETIKNASTFVATVQTYGGSTPIPINQASCNSYYTNAYPTVGANPVKTGGPSPATEYSAAYAKGTGGWTQTDSKNKLGTCKRTETVTTQTYTVNRLWGFSGYEYEDANLTTAGALPGGTVQIAGPMTVLNPTYAVDPPTKPTYYVSEQGRWDVRALALKFAGKPLVKIPLLSSIISPCLEERQTVQNLAMNPVPDAAWDLNINDPPIGDNDLTKWRGMWRDVYFTRTSSTVGSQAATPACPAPMRQFQEVDTTSTEVPAWMGTYLDSLTPTGSTYHDLGMIWGARLSSTRGLFASNVLEGDRNSVSRHIIFMTDGDMAPTITAYSSYGVEGYEHHVAPAGTTSSTLITYHNNRFLAACQRAKEEGYTIWLVGFGTSVTPVMKSCSSANRAYKANNTEELKAAFRYIAGQVADLRLNK